MLSDKQRSAAVDTLFQAEQSKQQALQLSEQYPEIQIEDSYAISQAVAQQRAASGDTLIGHKVGLTSRAMQQSSKIDEPDYGHIFESMLIPNGATVKHSEYCVPRVEPELTFVLGKPLRGPNIGLQEVLDATECVIPSIEIIDARVLDPRKIFDTVADNGAAAGIILGEDRYGPDELDLCWTGALFYRNTEIEETGIAAGVMKHPANAVAWLANKLASFGVGMDAGHMILSGSFTRPVWADPGDLLLADFGPAGRVSVNFE